MEYSLIQNAVEKRIAERQGILSKVIGDILGNVEIDGIAIIRFQVSVDNILTMAYNHLHKHLLHHAGALKRSGRLKWRLCRRSTSRSLALRGRLTGALFFSGPDHLIHLIDDDLLTHSQPKGCIVDIGSTHDIVRYQT